MNCREPLSLRFLPHHQHMNGWLPESSLLELCLLPLGMLCRHLACAIQPEAQALRLRPREAQRRRAATPKIIPNTHISLGAPSSAAYSTEQYCEYRPSCLNKLCQYFVNGTSNCEFSPAGRYRGRHGIRQPAGLPLESRSVLRLRQVDS